MKLGIGRSGSWLAAATVLALSGAPGSADAKPRRTPRAPYSVGNVERGEMHLELYRGAAVPFEITVIPTPNDCQGHLNLDIAWNKRENEVRVRLYGRNVLERAPDIDRTLGVNYRPNPFFPEPEDYEDGRYQLWIVNAAGPVLPFYYDPQTLDLIGGVAEFPEPPPAIPVPFPTVYMFATPMFEPDEHGNVDETWTFAYDGMVRGDRPEFSHHIVTFPPHNLCEVNPYRLDQSTLRPYISAPLPAAEARPWSDYLRGGLLFDVTVEPAEYFTEPPRTTLVATWSGGTAVGGNIPNGWTLDFVGAFANLAPPIKPWSGAGLCEETFADQNPGINYCGPQ